MYSVFVGTYITLFSPIVKNMFRIITFNDGRMQLLFNNNQRIAFLNIYIVNYS